MKEHLEQTQTSVIEAVHAEVDALTDDVRSLLMEMIGLPSLAGEELPTQEHVASWLRSKDMPSEQQWPDAGLESDPDYARYPDGHTRAPNVLTHIPSAKNGRSLLLNSHTDVVPAQSPHLFSAEFADGRISGRGACDAKGQVCTWLLAMAAIKQAGVALRGECVGAAVVEEEVGGNGTLSLIRQIKQPFDLAVVLEPTNFAVHPANRGAVWFKIEVQGKPTHMGRWWEGESAFENLEKILLSVREWDAGLVRESQGTPLFPDNPSPVHVNIGIVQAGDWPAKVPALAVAEGGVSFLPNKTLASIKAEMRRVVAEAANVHGLQASVSFERLQNEAYATPADHPAIRLFEETLRQLRNEAEVSGFLASCDARLLFHRGKIPTLVFGPGDLMLAHSDVESIELADIVTAAKALSAFVLQWCGVA